jgi:5-formyltetrahydrofolate cyclo-ligase
MKKIYLMFLPLLVLFAVSVCAAPLFDGYGKQPWGASIKSVTRAYPKGKLAKLGTQDIYKQVNPSKEIRQRTFAFAADKLVAVSVTMDPDYVTKQGIEKLLEKQKKLYGDGLVDRSGAPHMVTYRWQGQGTRITFAYAPKRPEMTVLMYEKK